MSALCQVRCHMLVFEHCKFARDHIVLQLCGGPVQALCVRVNGGLACPGFRTVLAVHGVVICYYLGPTRTASLTLRCALACAGYKFCETLVNSAPSGVRSRLCRLLIALLLLMWMLRSVAPQEALAVKPEPCDWYNLQPGTLWVTLLSRRL